MRQSLLLFAPLLLVATAACSSQGIEQALAPDPRLTDASQNPSSQPSDAPDPQAKPASSPKPKPGFGGYTDLDRTPPSLRPYLNDLLRLEQLPLSACGTEKCATFEPNQQIQRREYARWLLTANNRFYQDSVTKLIRRATETAKPVFTDVPSTDPDFDVIQGLAEAGLIPSRLSDEKASKQFNPNAPLTRADLILWKVPIDYRTTPPTAPLAKVAQETGFKDLTKATPPLLAALLADHKNGEAANFRRAFGYITIFQPPRPVTRIEAAAVLWSFGIEPNQLSAQTLLSPPPPQPPPHPSHPRSPLNLLLQPHQIPPHLLKERRLGYGISAYHRCVNEESISHEHS